MIKLLHRYLFLMCVLLGASQVHAGLTVDQLLSRDEAPVGVVFEIIADEDGLDWAVPAINDHVRQLRARWPGLEVAVVSHGREQFALMASDAVAYPKVHAGVRELVEEHAVPVHVCGTHAGWYGVQPEDFPAYVDVAPAGPAQINDYQALGFELVVIAED